MAQSQPKTLRPGEAMTARLFNSQAKSLQTSVGVAPGLAKRHLSKSVSIAPSEDTKAPTFPTQIIDAVIEDIKEDYLVCSRYNEFSDTTGGTILVAKQQRFRPSMYDGLTINYFDGDSITYTKDGVTPEWKREADNGTTAYTQRVIPCWYIGEIISVRAKPTSLVSDVDDGSVNINWEETETRVWAVEIP